MVYLKSILYVQTYSIFSKVCQKLGQLSTPTLPLRYHTSSNLPEHLDKYLDEPFTHQKSIELDRWLWYIQQEFELEGVQK